MKTSLVLIFAVVAIIIFAIITNNNKLHNNEVKTDNISINDFGITYERIDYNFIKIETQEKEMIFFWTGGHSPVLVETKTK